MQPRPLFLYDAGCGPCSKFKGLVSFLDASHAVNFVSIEDAGRLGLLSEMPPSELYSAARNIAKDGRVTNGGDALVSLMAELPGGRFPSAAVGMIPGGMSSVRRLYAVLSRLHSSSCTTDIRPTTATGAPG